MSNKSLYIVLGLIVIAITAVAILLPQTILDGVQKASIEVTSPAWRFMGWVQGKARLVKGSLETLDSLEGEVDELRRKNAELAAENSSLRYLKDENVRLRELVHFQQASPFRLMACKVVQRDPSNWWNAVIVNRGWADDKNLSPNQPVITPRGVVGKTGVVGKYSSRVILFVDENCKISAEVENTRARGIVMGTSGFSVNGPMARITFVSRETPISTEARVFTSGMGGVFPPGILIGTVKEAPPLSTERNFGLYRDGLIEPAVDLNDLLELFIIMETK